MTIPTFEAELGVGKNCKYLIKLNVIYSYLKLLALIFILHDKARVFGVKAHTFNFTSFYATYHMHLQIHGVVMEQAPHL